MCGIAGGFFWGETIDRRGARTGIDAMVDAVGHRGPDGNGTSLAGAEPNREPFVALGHTRLAIIDVSSAGAQPMGGPDGQPWVSFNGEIYNFASLRAELEGRGARFTSHSDTEVILR